MSISNIELRSLVFNFLEGCDTRSAANSHRTLRRLLHSLIRTVDTTRVEIQLLEGTKDRLTHQISDFKRNIKDAVPVSYTLQENLFPTVPNANREISSSKGKGNSNEMRQSVSRVREMQLRLLRIKGKNRLIEEQIKAKTDLEEKPRPQIVAVESSYQLSSPTTSQKQRLSDLDEQILKEEKLHESLLLRQSSIKWDPVHRLSIDPPSHPNPPPLSPLPTAISNSTLLFTFVATLLLLIEIFT